MRRNLLEPRHRVKARIAAERRQTHFRGGASANAIWGASEICPVGRFAEAVTVATLFHVQRGFAASGAIGRGLSDASEMAR
jgi:hypothetical protein